MRLSIILTLALMLSGFSALAFGGPGSTVLDIVGSKTDNTKIVEFGQGKVELEIIGSTASNMTITPHAGKICDHVNCDDGNPCTIDSCSAKGCVHVPINCDDMNPCTIDSCSAKGCVHVPVNCDDGKPCTIDLCGAKGCVHVPVNCDEGNLWTVDYCPSCLTHLGPYAKYDKQQKTYPWDCMNLGVDAWYGTFWYKEIYLPKWPQI